MTRLVTIDLDAPRGVTRSRIIGLSKRKARALADSIASKSAEQSITAALASVPEYVASRLDVERGR